MHIESLFVYPDIPRVDTPSGRCYLVEDSELPSVTTILSQVSDKSFLNHWVESIGLEESNRIREEAASIGTEMHNNLENHILGKPMTGRILPKLLAQLIINKGLVNLKSVIAVEAPLYSSGLYAGTVDLIARLPNDKLAIVDFKNSRREKSEDEIEDYRAQVAAYAIAHNEMFGTDIDSAIIMIANRDGKYQEFSYSGSNFHQCTELWLKKLTQFYNNK